ncbi:hypothetical protein F993_01514 [Acinetobacter proteolyticus]|uniref:DUF4760 domain-containing protein n=1 Tax=Acinetobacter proteolyticus TaxID=1776741 RepID=A0ABN0JG47_9GAMM|nr:hypothetical protein [Acinetobacter proteolyticus]ENU24198.1 hypothetical protein F993_01514 [Acinetobacter proteolyticus]
MAKKTLNKKIKTISFWTFGSMFWYLVIAFFLKSEYPIFNYRFNPSMAYDVIKDALTLAAAFLAPVAAFVLFSDWRDQHYQSKIENDAQQIYESIVGYLTILLRLERIVQKNQIDEKEHMVMMENRDQLKIYEEEVKRKIISFRAQHEFQSKTGEDLNLEVRSAFIDLKNAADGIRDLIIHFKYNQSINRYEQSKPYFSEHLFSEVYDNLDDSYKKIATLTTLKSKVKAINF